MLFLGYKTAEFDASQEWKQKTKQSLLEEGKCCKLDTRVNILSHIKISYD